MTIETIVKLADRYGFSMVITITLIITSIVTIRAVWHWFEKKDERQYQDQKEYAKRNEMRIQEFIDALRAVTNEFSKSQRLTKANHKDMVNAVQVNHRETLAIIEKIGETAVNGLKEARDEHDMLMSNQHSLQDGQKSIAGGVDEIRNLLKKN